jgi:hypothetical protein
MMRGRFFFVDLTKDRIDCLGPPNRPVRQAISPAKASSVPGIKHTAVPRLSTSAKPRVPVPKSRVTSLSPTFAGRDCTLWRLKSHIAVSILPRRNREAFNAPQPITCILQQSCRISRSNAVRFLAAVRAASSSGQSSRAAYALRRSEPARQSHYGLSACALYSSRAEDTPSGWRAPDALWAICQPWPTALATAC